VLQVDGNQFHIDPGPGAVVKAIEYGVNPRAHTAVLVSNNNLLHSGDINAVIDSMTYGGFDKRGVLIGNISTISECDTGNSFLHLKYKNLLERCIALEAGQKVGINDIEIKAIKTKHFNKNTIGFKFFTNDFTLVYSSDTVYSRDLIEEYKNSNILILNMSCLSKQDSEDTLCRDDIINIIKEVNPRLAIITHFGNKIIESDPLYEVREIQKQTGVQTIAAKDGMIINPLSYAVSLGQKTLNVYSKEDKEIRIDEPSEKTPSDVGISITPKEN